MTNAERGDIPAAGTEDIIRAILMYQPRGVSQIRLLKLYYLAELRYISKNSARLSPAVYFKYNNGPYSIDVIKTVKELPENIVESKPTTLYGNENCCFFYPRGDCAPDLEPELAEFMRDFMNVYMYMPTNKIIQCAYATAPFLWAEFDEDINFELWAEVTRAFRDSDRVQQAVDESLAAPPAFTSDSLDDFYNYLMAPEGSTRAS